MTRGRRRRRRPGRRSGRAAARSHPVAGQAVAVEEGDEVLVQQGERGVACRRRAAVRALHVAGADRLHSASTAAGSARAVVDHDDVAADAAPARQRVSSCSAVPDGDDDGHVVEPARAGSGWPRPASSSARAQAPSRLVALPEPGRASPPGPRAEPQQPAGRASAGSGRRRARAGSRRSQPSDPPRRWLTRERRSTAKPPSTGEGSRQAPSRDVGAGDSAAHGPPATPAPRDLLRLDQPLDRLLPGELLDVAPGRRAARSPPAPGSGSTPG